MTSTPPFDPPYKISSAQEDGSVAWMEVRADGSSVATSAPVLVMPAASAAPARASQPQRAVTVLNVPFAEKDEAKQLGARWDPKRRKWCVPAGVDLAPFSRWSGGAGE
jgi:hypothetical protein